MSQQNITVLLPAYNEGDRIKNTIDALRSSPYVNRIVVIDDGSIDDTFSIAQKSGAIVYRFDKNKGKGYALQYGVQKVIADSDVIVFLDADLADTAREVDKLIIPLLENKADVTIAKFPPAKKKGGFGLVKNLAKFGVRFYTGHTIHTSLSGQRAFRAQVLKSIPHISAGYGVEVGMTIDILNMGFRIQEVEVNMTHRETGRNLKGFIHRGKQFYHILITLLRKYNEVKKR